jgi:DNA repair protein RadC
MNVTEQELIAIRGIGKGKAKQIVASLRLARKLNSPNSNHPHIIRNPKDAADLLIPEMRFLQQEHFCIIFLNTKNHVIGQPETLSIGTLDSALVHPREIFRAAVRRSAASIIACHNHPSGDPTPSQEDIQFTTRLVNASEIIGISLLDHLTIGGCEWISMKERGLM